MSSYKTRVNDLTKLIQACKLQVINKEISGSSHCRFLLQRNDGKQMLFFASLSPSDHRASLNNRALLRRFAKELTA